MTRDCPARIAIAPNAFKGTLTAMEAARVIARGLRPAVGGAEMVLVPVADGGDGTADTVVQATRGRRLLARVHDPLGRPIRARWGLAGDGKTAVIEMASASGLVLVSPRDRRPLAASTRGTGELLLAAIDRGVRHILLGIGGSATTDGGTGMARALGARFLDRLGRDLPEGGGALTRLARITIDDVDPRVRGVRIGVACDVDNPLAGPRGAAWVYGPQKGATPAMVRQLDDGLRRLAEVVSRDLGVATANLPGAGAAGGLGGGLVAFTGAALTPGADAVLELLGFRERIANCDLVITGEGRLDVQTASGKAPAAVARIASSLGIPTIAICGCVAAGFERRQIPGLVAWFSALEEPVADADLKRRAPAMLRRCAEQVGRALALGSMSPRPVRHGRRVR